jgi:hypothetical protein
MLIEHNQIGFIFVKPACPSDIIQSIHISRYLGRDPSMPLLFYFVTIVLRIYPCVYMVVFLSMMADRNTSNEFFLTALVNASFAVIVSVVVNETAGRVNGMYCARFARCNTFFCPVLNLYPIYIYIYISAWYRLRVCGTLVPSILDIL